MTGVELLALAEKTAFTKLVSGALSKIGRKLGGGAKYGLRRRTQKLATEELLLNLRQVRLVKTLWQYDQAVDIGEFYCESHVYLRGKRTKIVSMAEFQYFGNILLEGIAGQGKSIFLRYLCAVELARGEYLPVFLELREVRHSKTLLGAILFRLQELGLPLTEEEFKTLAAFGYILLLLDGFDEVSEDEKSQIVHELEHLIACNHRLQIVVSSRPHSGLEVVPSLWVVQLSDLEGDEYKNVILKLLPSEQVASELIKRVEDHSGEVKALLTTPLLVTLLVVNYKAFQDIPAQLSDFYDSIFKILLQRHDGTKPGFHRPKLCTLNDAQYRDAFEVFCYLTKRYKDNAFPSATIYSLSKEALAAIESDETPDYFLRDIVEITCLLVTDGGEYRFIHKSVQEYYAACYIRSRPDVVARKVYHQLFQPDWSGWHMELLFCAEIDAYRYNNYGLLPTLLSYLELNETQLEHCTPDLLVPIMLKHLYQWRVIVRASDERQAVVGTSDVPRVLQALFGELLFLPASQVNYAPICKREYLEKGYLKDFHETGDYCILFAKLLDNGVFLHELGALAHDIALNLLKIAKAGQSRIRAGENDRIALMALPTGVPTAPG